MHNGYQSSPISSQWRPAAFTDTGENKMRAMFSFSNASPAAWKLDRFECCCFYAEPGVIEMGILRETES